MNIIAWNKDLNEAIEPVRLPNSGEFARFKTDTHTEYKYFYNAVEPEKIKVKITSITGDEAHKSDFSFVTQDVSKVMIVCGTAVGATARRYNMPFYCTDGSYLIVPTTIREDGTFEATVQFKSNGSYRFSNEEANRHLPYSAFEVKTMWIDVVG